MASFNRNYWAGPMLAALLASNCTNGPPLPQHSVERAELYDDNARVTVKVRSDISKAQCEALVDEYRSIAGPNGQVAVRKPSARLEGKLLPWCVDNMDGAGVTFNSDWF